MKPGTGLCSFVFVGGFLLSQHSRSANHNDGSPENRHNYTRAEISLKVAAIWKDVVRLLNTSPLRQNYSDKDEERLMEAKRRLWIFVRESLKKGPSKEDRREIVRLRNQALKIAHQSLSEDDRDRYGAYCALPSLYSEPRVLDPSNLNLPPYSSVVRFHVGSGVLVSRRVILTASHNLPLGWLRNPATATETSPFQDMGFVYPRFFGNPEGFTGVQLPPTDALGQAVLNKPQFILPLEGIRHAYEINMSVPEVADGSTGLNSFSSWLPGLDPRDNDDLMAVAFTHDIADDSQVAVYRGIDTAEALTSKAPKIMVGYPRSFYGANWQNSVQPNIYKMHATGPTKENFVPRIPWSPTPNTYWGCSLAAYGGNSGGPLYAQVNGKWVLTGIVTNGLPHEGNGQPKQVTGMVGVRLLDQEVINLIDKAKKLVGEN